jgi:acetoacetyl-CoA synthetase
MSSASPIVWHPSKERIEASALMAFARMARDFFGAPQTLPDEDYRALHAWSVEHPDRFWAAVWSWAGVIGDGAPSLPPGEPGIPQDPGALGAPEAGRVWERPTQIASVAPGGFSPDSRPRWFPDARLNVAENLLKGADALPPDTLALISWDESGRRSTMTFRDLARDARAFARSLRAAGVRPGDRVAGFLPNIPETVVAFLGCAAVGAVWSSCSPDFGVQAVVDRFGQIEPRVLVAATGYRYKGRVHDLEMRITEIARLLPSVESVVLVPWQHPTATRSTDAFEPCVEHPSILTWQAWLAHGEGPDALDASAPGGYPRLPFDHPLVILYSSGTTGLPKCIVHGAGGTLLQHRKEHALHVDLRAGDRFFYFTTCGWMMWNWLVTGLAQGATLVLYDGAPVLPETPDILWKLAAAESLAVMGLSARYLAMMEKSDLEPGQAHDLTALRTILSTGSPLAPSSFDWVYGAVKEDVHLASISGGTDIVSCFVGGVPTQPVRRGEIQGPGLGMAVEILQSDGPEAPLGNRILETPGELVCRQPFPSMPIGFWNDPDHVRYTGAYFARHPGIWCHGDWAEETASGGFRIHGRSDATLNPGGVRIGTAELYREVEAIPEILEAVAVGWERPGATSGDEVIALYVRMRDGLLLTPDLERDIRERIRTHASPHHVPRFIQAVSDLPRTVSGKLSEIAVREHIHGRPVRNRDALANPEALDGIAPPRPAAASALVGRVVDYAGLFPPASLPMASAVANFAQYAQGPDRWALGRFVVMAKDLDAFRVAAEPFLANASPETPWELSVLVGPDMAADLEAITRTEAASGARVRVASIETRLDAPDLVVPLLAQIRGMARPPQEIWFELPVLALPGAPAPTDRAQLEAALLPFFEALHGRGGDGGEVGGKVGGKVRTGGVHPHLFPTPEALLTVLGLAARFDIPFKATAGLHHPLRGRYPLTYAEDAELGTMFGYLNVLLAMLALRQGEPDAARDLLILEDPRALSWQDDGISWEHLHVPIEAIRALRARGLTSFGSCSLREPVDELVPILRSARPRPPHPPIPPS